MRIVLSFLLLAPFSFLEQFTAVLPPPVFLPSSHLTFLVPREDLAGIESGDRANGERAL